MPTNQHKYTEEQKQFLCDNIMNYSYRELTEAFNKEFNLSLGLNMITGALKRMGLRNGRDTKFHTGQVPFNKDKKGIHLSPATEFKKGHVPVNYRPIGSERAGKSRSSLGYIEVKVADPNIWKMKHSIIWEAVHGTIPKGHCVIFADRDKSNFDIDNLLLVSRAELLRMNQNGYIFTNPDITKSGHLVVKLETALGQKKHKSNADR